MDHLGPQPAARVARPRDAREGTPEARAALALAVLLIALAGWVDGAGFVAWQGLYASFMSGNTAEFGASTARGGWGDAARVGAAIGTFVAGVVAGELIGPAAGRRRAPAVVTAESALLWAAAASSAAGWGEAATASLAGLAMGVQTAAIHRADGVSVALTYVTGTLVNLGRGLAGALRGAEPWNKALPFAGFWLSLLVGAAGGAAAARASLDAALVAAAAFASALALFAGALVRHPET